MSPTRNGPTDALSVSPSQGAWRWQVRGQTGELEGGAETKSSAWKTAAFAAGALESLSRVTKRRF